MPHNDLLDAGYLAGMIAPLVAWGVHRWRKRRAFDAHFAAMGQRLGFKLLSAQGAEASHVRRIGPESSHWAVVTDYGGTSSLPGAGMFRTPANTSMAFAGVREGLLIQTFAQGEHAAHVAITCYFGERLLLADPVRHIPSGVFLLSPKRSHKALLVTLDTDFDARFLVSVAGPSWPMQGHLALPIGVRSAAMALAYESELTLLYDGVSAVVTVRDNPSDETFLGILRLLQAFEDFVPELLQLRAEAPP